MANPKNWLVARNLHHRLPDGRELYSGLELTLGPNITALIGENGVGKSTLAAQIAGESSDESRAQIQHLGRIGYLPQQELRPNSGCRLVDFLEESVRFFALQRIARGEGGDEDFDIVADAWDLPTRLAMLLAKVGLPPLDPFTPIDCMSGGELARLALVRLLLAEPDHLILDEPGNHLDREGRMALIGLLRDFRGGILLISHDRQLLELAEELLDLGPWGLHKYHGRYDDYRQERRRKRLRQEQVIAAERRHLICQRREAQRNLEKHQRREAMGRAARRSGGQSTLLLDRQAERSERTRGRLRRLSEDRLQQAGERLQTAVRHHDPEGSARLVLAKVKMVGGSQAILHCGGLRFRHRSERPLIEDFSLHLAPGERLELRGPNGSGKSTLLRLFSGELQPQGGELRCKVPLARLDQHLSLLSPQANALENFSLISPGLTRHDYYARLDALGLPRERLALPCARLSGGEQVRLALACLLLGPEPAQLLLLDEPTNHLDMVAVEALESALKAYPGAIIVVSHDERFVAQLGIDRVVNLSVMHE